MTTESIIGYIAAGLTMIAFLPTIYDIYKKGTARHVCIYSTTLYLVSLILWVIYSYLIEAWPLLIQCAFSGVVQFVILVLILFSIRKWWKKPVVLKN